MARYDARCPLHGEHEVSSVPSVARAGVVPCATCGGDAALVFTPERLPGVRIDCAAEDVARSVAPGRVADGSAKFNLGLAGVSTSLGRDASGKERTAYRPISNVEVGSNQNAREIAKRNNLTPVDGGRYRSIA